MKHKTLAIVAAAACCHAASAALVTFETFDLEPESFLNGSDAGGEFIASGVAFNNNYNGDDDWSGFAISNVTDNNSGSANPFSAITGGGYDGSANYAIGNFDGTFSTYLTFGSLTNLAGLGAYFTNTTWAVYDMLNGDDGFGSRPFDGDIPDFYKIVIQGYSGSNESDKTGQIEFNLADFTGYSGGDPQDYIVTDWRYVPFSELGWVSSLYFSIESSDPNKPMYFAMDNFLVVPEPSSLLMALGGLGLLLRRKR